MNPAQLELLRIYIDCRIEENEAENAEAADGYRQTPISEQIARTEAWDNFVNSFNQP